MQKKRIFILKYILEFDVIYLSSFRKHSVKAISSTLHLLTTLVLRITYDTPLRIRSGKNLQRYPTMVC